MENEKSFIRRKNGRILNVGYIENSISSSFNQKFPVRWSKHLRKYKIFYLEKNYSENKA